MEEEANYESKGEAEEEEKEEMVVEVGHQSRRIQQMTMLRMWRKRQEEANYESKGEEEKEEVAIDGTGNVFSL